MSTKVAVVIPTYKAELSPLEKISLAQCRKVLSRYPIIHAVPAGQNFAYFKPGEHVAEFPAQFFQNVASYNRLMLSPGFYATFKAFDYILIYQLDAFVFYDALENFCNLGYDYIGAPWPRIYRQIRAKIISCVGNGGFSLRNVKAHYKLLTEHAPLVNAAQNMPEDNFFSHCGKRGDCNFNVAPIDVAYKFSAEFNPARVVKKNGGKLPFGCHAWHNHNPEFYAAIFRQIGYDLQPLKHLLTFNDGGLRDWLNRLATRRLIRRAERGQSLSHYLPTKNFASVRVVRSPDAVKILARLMLEDSSIAEKIFIRDVADAIALIDDMRRENLPHLLIAQGNVDVNLLVELDRRGFVYGEHIISFQLEYLKRCAQLLRTFGRRT